MAAPDSFKGTASATEMAQAVGRAARESGWICDLCPLSDGGEGFAEVLAGRAAAERGRWRTTTVTGPLGSPIIARWWWAEPEAVVESAAASGLVLAGGASGNDPMAATSRGTGELVAAALRAGAQRVLVGLGGSACTDGGLGALEALEEAGGLRSAEVLAACDVVTSFVEAAGQFGPQKGATPAQVEQLRRRLVTLVGHYRERFGVDVGEMTMAGAAGGLAGGLAVLGARLLPGFELVAEATGMKRRVVAADLVVTGEGRLDLSSWAGKVVGGVVREARLAGVHVLVIAGSVGPGGIPVPQGPGIDGGVEVVSLAERFGEDRAMASPAACAEEAARELLADR